MSSKSNPITLAAVGDLSFSRGTESTFFEKGAAYLFEEVCDDLAAADVCFGNLESVLIPDSFPLERASGRPLQSRDAVVEALRPLRLDVLHRTRQTSKWISFSSI